MIPLGPRCGNIGDDPREYEVEPLTAPAEVPAEPERVSA